MTETKPKVSVLIATYNHARYVRVTLESVLAQETRFPFEVVICDDGSSDGTRNIIEEYAARYPLQLRLSCREKNAGDKGLTNFLLGLQMCRGEYIATLDGDDYWIDSSKLQRQTDFLDSRSDYSMCFHNCRVEYEDGQSWDTVRFLSGERVTTEDLLKNSMGQMSTIVIRQDVAAKLRESVRLLNDWLLSDWFIGIVASQLGFVGYIDRVMSVFRQHHGSGFTSLGRATQWAEFVYGFEAVEEMLGKRYRDLVRQAICVRSYTAAVEYERDRDFVNARRFLSRALKGDPAWLEPYCAGYGLTGEDLFRVSARRLQLYRFPALCRVWLSLEDVWRKARQRWLAAELKIRSHLRLRRGRAVGFITASPNPAIASPRSPGRVAVTLEWRSAAVAFTELRLGRPDGLLLSRAGFEGKKMTGEWVGDGMTFYLQNVSDDLPLTLANTLDVVSVAVKG